MKKGNRKGEIWHQLISEIKSKQDTLLNTPPGSPNSKKDKD